MERVSSTSKLSGLKPKIAVRSCTDTNGVDQDQVVEVAYSHTGVLLAACVMDQTVRIWNTTSGKQLTVFRAHACIASLAFFKDDCRIVCGSADGYLGVWMVSSGDILWDCKMSDLRVTCVSASPSGKLVASGTEDGTLQLSDANTGEKHNMKLNRCNEITGPIIRVSFSNNGNLVYSYSELGVLQKWDISNRSHPICMLDGDINSTRPAISCVAFSTISSHMVCGYADGEVYIYDLGTFEELRLPKRHTKWVESITTRKYGKLLRVASGSQDGFLSICDVSLSDKKYVAGAIKRQLGKTVWFVEMSGDGNKILSCTASGYAQIWDLSSVDMLMNIDLLDDEAFTDRDNWKSCCSSVGVC